MSPERQKTFNSYTVENNDPQERTPFPSFGNWKDITQVMIKSPPNLRIKKAKFV